MINPDPIEGLLFAEHAIKYVIDLGAKQLYKKYLMGKIPFYTSVDIINWNDGVIQQQYQQLDYGESKYQILNRWNEEEEPKIQQLDSIATLSVRLERQKVAPQVVSGGDDTDDNKSLRSNSTRVSFASKFQRATRKLTQLNSLTKKGADNVPESEVIHDDSYVYEFIEMPDDRPVPEPDPIAERMRDEREIKNKDRQREQERMKKIREDQTSYDEKKKEQQRLLKHKHYTWDFDGEIILLKHGKGSEAVLVVNEILQIDGKSKDPGIVVKENNTVPEVKPVKEGMKGEDDRHKYDKAIAQEYPKQPPLIESILPRVGVDVIFENGYVKEGGQFKRGEKISKEEYNQLILNQPRIKPLYGQQDQIIEANLQNKYSDNNEGDQDEVDIPYLVNNKINIDNLDHYMAMLAKETLRKSSNQTKETNIQSQIRQTNLSLSKVKLAKYKAPHKQVNLERINAYMKEPLMHTDNPILNFDKETKLHKALNKFDHELMDNPSWGMVGAVKDNKVIATSFKHKNHSSSKSLKNQSDLFPPIGMKNNRAQRAS